MTNNENKQRELTPAEFRCLRERLGLTEKWLSHRWDVSIQSILRWERYRTLPQELSQDIRQLSKDFDSSVDSLAKKYKEDTTLEIPATGDASEDTANSRYPQRMVRAIAWAVHEKTGCKIAYPDGAWEGKYGN